MLKQSGNRRICMNEGITIYLNMEEREFDKNEALIRKIDEFLLNFGIKYTGIRNVYTPIKSRDRDHAVFIACRALRDADWLKGRLAYASIIHRTDACSMEQIKLDNMQKPSAAKLKYYERYYQKSHTLAHSIVVDEQGYLRDGYISYILACKYGIRPDIYEAFIGQPLKKTVRGRHILRNNDTWRIKSNKSYIWNYTLKNPVVPGDILKADTKNGPQFICVDGIDYVTGKEFSEGYRNVKKHMKERLQCDI